MEGDLKCDFCYTPDPKRKLDVVPFGLMMQTGDGERQLHRFDEGWMACPRCGWLIDNDQWERLKRHAVHEWCRRSKKGRRTREAKTVYKMVDRLFDAVSRYRRGWINE